MSLTQRDTNGEPRRDNSMAHEEGTWLNSELTHHQMPLSQSMIDQSKMRKKRSQDCKAHNVEKHASQKEQRRWWKAEVPDNVHEMRSALHTHCLFLLKVKDQDFASLPEKG
ncbi:hypothetical protein O181_046209 [Austropuccinia psidii MF-1]|uniref:Uncharacterized protein n=1 Tax=Austropuccinia psidii MF-1 TaxID=1389203 RepID=A0A9Q3DNG9_9BASI|nr:hypothetical protein [Austropuccinia psidii MF-1]